MLLTAPCMFLKKDCMICKSSVVCSQQCTLLQWHLCVMSGLSMHMTCCCMQRMMLYIWPARQLSHQLLHQVYYLLLLQGTTGRVLQKAQYLVEMEHAKHVKSHPLLASESTFLVLWLPSTYQRQPKQKSRVSSGDTEDRHLRPGNDILLGQAWACLRQIQQVMYCV